MNVALAVRDAIECQGIGPSKWGLLDCVTIVRAVIDAQGVAAAFKIPHELGSPADEAAAVKAAIREFGSLRKGWLKAVEREHHLREWAGPPDVGMIGLTADDFTIGGRKAEYGPSLAVYGPDIIPLCRTPNGLAVAHPIERLWRVVR